MTTTVSSEQIEAQWQLQVMFEALKDYSDDTSSSGPVINIKKYTFHRVQVFSLFSHLVRPRWVGHLHTCERLHLDK